MNILAEKTLKNLFSGDIFDVDAVGNRFSSLFLVAPESPTNVEIADVDADRVTLEWMKPRGMGTNKPTGYVVEYKSPDGEWTKADIGPIRGTSATGKIKFYLFIMFIRVAKSCVLEF